MTVREIADAVGKKERTVHNWVLKTSAKNAEVYAKIAEAREKSKAADYSLDQTLEIIETGMGKNAAGIYRASIKNNEKGNGDAITRSDLAAFGTTIVTEVMKQFLPLLQNQNKQIEFVQDYYTIKGYASKLGQQITFTEALNLGRIAGKLSREKNTEIRKVDDERFGLVNSYSVKVLEEVFQI
jgi:predicted transcriptional regulator